jgi:hypothetical protein
MYPQILTYVMSFNNRVHLNSEVWVFASFQ